jgi:hypothetical protein
MAVDAKELELAFRELIAAMERGREWAIQRSPLLRRDFDNALGAAQKAVEQLRLGKIEVARNLWVKNPALRAIARQYDAESERVSAAFE